MDELFLRSLVLLLWFHLSVNFVVFIIKLCHLIWSLSHHSLLLVLMRRTTRALILLLYFYLLLLNLMHAGFITVCTQIFNEMLQVVYRLRIHAVLLIEVLRLEEAFRFVLLIHFHQPTWLFLSLDVILGSNPFQILWILMIIFLLLLISWIRWILSQLIPIGFSIICFLIFLLQFIELWFRLNSWYVYYRWVTTIIFLSEPILAQVLFIFDELLLWLVQIWSFCNWLVILRVNCILASRVCIHIIIWINNYFIIAYNWNSTIGFFVERWLTSNWSLWR